MYVRVCENDGMCLQIWLGCSRKLDGNMKRAEFESRRKADKNVGNN